MINNKLISIKRIISKVYSDLGVAEENIPVTDIIKWAAEALEKIEAPTLLTKKVTGKEGIPLLEIKDYQASLPKDLVDIEQVAYSTSKYSSKFYPMVYATVSFSGRHGLTSDIDNEYYEDPNKDDIPSDYSLVSLAQ